MLVLNFDFEKFQEDLQNTLIKAADECMKHFYLDASDLKSNDIELRKATIKAKDYIVAECMFYANAIMESYGTGDNMDDTNEYIDEYMSSNLWNPLRDSFTIVGRKAGQYINILGEKDFSLGKSAGFPTGNPGRLPTYDIQNAEKKLKQGGYVQRILDKHIEDFLENAGQYFYNTEV